ncbi:hypothetical protein PoB_005823500 [Plakobranchus ocellatus]|uniref:Uncharacterized protein n=1 Tax=Plakobranchus ocellatus TaxID=259542 RepID=A0AAV4CIT5_9GAST|nr:hypothetical protein PoB_005823500 [Plakobranchus ocellatus]
MGLLVEEERQPGIGDVRGPEVDSVVDEPISASTAGTSAIQELSPRVDQRGHTGQRSSLDALSQSQPYRWSNNHLSGWKGGGNINLKGWSGCYQWMRW